MFCRSPGCLSPSQLLKGLSTPVAHSSPPWGLWTSVQHLSNWSLFVHGSLGHWNIDPQLFLVQTWSPLFLALQILVFSILVIFHVCLLSYFSMLCNIPLITFCQETQRTRWFIPPPTQPCEAGGSPPYFSEVQNYLAPAQLCFSSCQATADQTFFYTLKINMQQSVLMHDRVEARS